MIRLGCNLMFALIAVLVIAMTNLTAAAAAARWDPCAQQLHHDRSGEHRLPESGAAPPPHGTAHCANGCTILTDAPAVSLHLRARAVRPRPPRPVALQGQSPPGLFRPPRSDRRA